MSPIKRLKQLLKVDKKDIYQVYVYAFINGIVNLSLPIGIQAIINLIQGGEPSTAWVILVSFVIVGIALMGLLQLLQLRIVENISQKIFSRATFEFAFRFPRIKYEALYNYYAPELANRFFDTLTIQKGLPKLLIDFSLSLFQIILGLVLLSFYHPFFIVYSIILIALVYVIIAVTGPKGLSTSLSESKFKYKIAFWLEEIARTKLSFKLISKSNIELKNSNFHLENYLNAREKHFRVLVQQFSYLIGFKILIAAGLLITGSILVFNQQMNIGQFVAAEIIIILIIASVEKLIKSVDSVYDVLTALEKIGYVTDLPLEVDEGLNFKSDTQDFSLSVSNLSYKYPDLNINTIHDINFHLPKGNSLLIKGNSGSGKSTLMKLLIGLQKPSAGVIRFNDFPMNSLHPEKLRFFVGFKLNYSDLFQGTILENIVMGRTHVDPKEVTRALKIVNLLDYLSSLSFGLNTVLDPGGQKIPRSVQDKLLLARAIVSKPKLIFLEDPLEHVESIEKEIIIKRLFETGNNWSIIVNSVDPIWAQYIPNYIELDKGKIVEQFIKE